MKIIDTHMHFSDLSEYRKMAEQVDQITSLNGVLQAMSENNIVAGIGIGIGDLRQHYEFSAPMTLNFDKDWDPEMGIYAPAIACCPGMDPYMLTKYPGKYLKILKAYLKNEHIVGIKIYLGYYPFYAYDLIYTPIYELAELLGVPVVFHTGDLAGTQGLLEYAQPLQIDRVASKYPNVKFVIAHFGNPWLLDAASVVLKNPNVFVDLSGLIVGSFKSHEILHLQKGYFDYLKCALDYLYSYDKLLYASDWPFAPIHEYISLVKTIIPAEYHSDVFFNNALKVFPRIKKLL